MFGIQNKQTKTINSPVSKQLCNMQKKYVEWKHALNLEIRISHVHIYDEQATDSTGAHTKGKAHCYHIKATIKALLSQRACSEIKA